MNTNPKRIDVHHHILPPAFISALNSLNVPWTGGPEIPTWSLSQAHDMMGQMGIDAAVASASPGVHWGGDTGFAVKLAHETNEFLAEVVRDDPDHFGAFATMPLPDVDASLRDSNMPMTLLVWTAWCCSAVRVAATLAIPCSTRSLRNWSAARRSCSSTPPPFRPAPTRRV